MPRTSSSRSAPTATTGCRTPACWPARTNSATALAVVAGASPTAQAKPLKDASASKTDVVDRHLARATAVDDSLQRQVQAQTTTVRADTDSNTTQTSSTLQSID